LLKNKKWITIIVLAFTLVILFGVLGGMACAATGTTATSNTTASDSGKALYARVATILGIDQRKLEAALTQAQKEMRGEELTNRLKIMVIDGTISQAQADAYLKWWQSRPDVASQIDIGGGQGIPEGPHGMQGPGGNAPPAPTTTPAK